jgi:hypothetical protein
VEDWSVGVVQEGWVVDWVAVVGEAVWEVVG